VTEDGLFGARGRRVLVYGAGIVVLLLLVYVGVRALSAPPAAPRVAQGQVRLGPDPEETVAGYRARAAQSLPPPGRRAVALVQLGAEVTTEQAAGLAGSLPVDEAVLRVPLPRVQTALRFATLPAGAPVAGALDTARQQARYAAEADASRLTGRPAAVARAEAGEYAGACACVLALVVEGDRAALDTVAAAPGVRVVEAAPVGVTAPELALSPLLPEQTESATPPPDDGPL
jgi:hypothetical protein